MTPSTQSHDINHQSDERMRASCMIAFCEAVLFHAGTAQPLPWARRLVRAEQALAVYQSR